MWGGGCLSQPLGELLEGPRRAGPAKLKPCGPHCFFPHSVTPREDGYHLPGPRLTQASDPPCLDARRGLCDSPSTEGPRCCGVFMGTRLPMDTPAPLPRKSQAVHLP